MNRHHIITMHYTMKIRTNMYLIIALLLAPNMLIKCEDNIDSPTAGYHFNNLHYDLKRNHLDSIAHHTNFLKSGDLSEKNLNDKNNKVIHSVEVVNHDGKSITKYETTSHSNQELFDDTPSFQSYTIPDTKYTQVVKKTVIKRINSNRNDSNEPNGSSGSIDDKNYISRKNKSKEIGVGNSISKYQTMSQKNDIESNNMSLMPPQHITDSSNELNNIIYTTVLKTISTTGNELTPPNNIISTTSSSNLNDFTTGFLQPIKMDEDNTIKTMTKTTQINRNDIPRQITYLNPEDGSYRRVITTIIRHQNSNDDNDSDKYNNAFYSEKSKSLNNNIPIMNPSEYSRVMNFDKSIIQESSLTKPKITTSEINNNEIGLLPSSRQRLSLNLGSVGQTKTTVIGYQGENENNDYNGLEDKMMENNINEIDEDIASSLNSDTNPYSIVSSNNIVISQGNTKMKNTKIHDNNYKNAIDNNLSGKLDLLNKSIVHGSSLSESKETTSHMNYDSNDLLLPARFSSNPSQGSFAQTETTLISHTNPNSDFSHKNLDDHSNLFDIERTKSSNNIGSIMVLPGYNQLQSVISNINRESTNNINKENPYKKQINKINKYINYENSFSEPKTTTSQISYDSIDVLPSIKQTSNSDLLRETKTKIVKHQCENNENDFKGSNGGMVENISEISTLNNDGGSMSESESYLLMKSNRNSLYKKKKKNMKKRKNYMKNVKGARSNKLSVQNMSYDNKYQSNKRSGKTKNMDTIYGSSGKKNKGSKSSSLGKYENKLSPESSSFEQNYSRELSMKQKCDCCKKQKLNKRSSESNENTTVMKMGPPSPPEYLSMESKQGKHMDFRDLDIPSPFEFIKMQYQRGNQINFQGMGPPSPPEYLSMESKRGKHMDFRVFGPLPTPEFMNLQSQKDNYVNFKEMGPPPPLEYMSMESKQGKHMDFRDLGPLPTPVFMNMQSQKGNYVNFKEMGPPPPLEYMSMESEQGKHMDFRDLGPLPTPVFMNMQSQKGNYVNFKEMGPPPPLEYMSMESEQGKHMDFRDLAPPSPSEFMKMQYQLGNQINLQGMGPSPIPKFMNAQSEQGNLLNDNRLLEKKHDSDNDASTFKQTGILNAESIMKASHSNGISNNINDQNIKYTKTIKTIENRNDNNTPIIEFTKTTSSPDADNTSNYIQVDSNESNDRGTRDSS